MSTEQDSEFFSQVTAPSSNRENESTYSWSKGRFHILNPKQKLLNIVCASLVSEPSFFNDMSLMSSLTRTDHARNDRSWFLSMLGWVYNRIKMADDVEVASFYPQKHEILDLVYRISRRDGEFVLKLAHYVRIELGIRSTANFLLAACATCTQCVSGSHSKTFLNYFASTIKLPSDWLEVCSFYVVIRRHLLSQWLLYHPDQTHVLRTLLRTSRDKHTVFVSSIKALREQVVPGRDLPHALQVAMKEKFLDFDAHQLAKYNKENSMKRKLLKQTYLERREAKKGKTIESYQSSGRGCGSGRGRGRGGFIRGRGGRRIASQRTNRRAKKKNDEKEDGEQPIDDIDENSEDSEDVIDSDDESEDHVEKQVVKADKSTKIKLSGKLNTKPQFTMKKMIRRLHMSEPSEYVMSLLGKKYPETEEQFLKYNLHKPPLTRIKGKRRDTEERKFDPMKCGTRMKLPIPVTWETELSANGNNAASWQNLIDSGKLPFMAMLRNLRNLLVTGISPAHHEIIINKLRDAETIRHSQQFPFRFFSAYQSIDIDLKLLKKYKKMSKADIAELEATSGKIIVPEHMPDEDLLNRYREALDQAVQHAVTNNIKQIQGNTAIFVDVSESMQSSVCSSAKAGNFTSAIDIAVLLGLMCNFVCESSQFLIYSSPSMIYNDSNYQNMTELLKKGHILDNMKLVLRRVDQMGAIRQFPLKYLELITEERTVVDQIIVLSDMQWDQSNRKLLTDTFMIQSMIKRYRKTVNPNMLFICIDLFGSGSSIVSMNEGQKDPRDITITGFSDQILRFIAEKSDSAQLRHVQNIEVNELQLLLPNKKKKKKQRKSKKTKKSKQKGQDNTSPVTMHSASEIRFLSTPFKNLKSIYCSHSFTKVISKSKHCIFLTTEGSVYGMGKPGSIFSTSTEQLTLLLDQTMIQKITGAKTKDEHVIDISSGLLHIAALTNLGRVFVMGCNSYNQLGRVTDTEYINSMEMVVWEDPTTITSVACGDNHTLFVSEQGKLYACGRNDLFQLGQFVDEGSTPKYHSLPREVALPNNIAQIVSVSAGGSHSAVLDKNGNLWMMGNNSQGQCGIPSVLSSLSVLTRVTDFDGEKLKDKDKVVIRSVSCGEYHTAALDKDGKLFVFGSDYYGQLGIRENQKLNRSKVQQVLGYPSDNFIQGIECSKQYTTVITRNGTVYTSGSDDPSDKTPKHCSLVSMDGKPATCASFGEEFKVVVVDARSIVSRNNLKMLSDDLMYNMRLKIGGDSDVVKLHEYMIDVRCPLFKSVLCEDASGTTSRTDGKSEFALKTEYCSEILGRATILYLIEFIYTDHIGFHPELSRGNDDVGSSTLAREHQESLIRLAHLLKLDRLAWICQLDDNRSCNSNNIGIMSTVLQAQHQSTLEQDMEKLLTKQQATPECVISASSNLVPCHCAILAAQSDYFGNVLGYDYGFFLTLRDDTDQMSASRNESPIKLSIPLDEEIDSLQAIQILLLYCYTGKVNLDQIKKDNCLDVLRMADLLCLSGLLEEVQSSMLPFIDTTNVSIVLDVADYYGWTLLKQQLISFIVKDRETEKQVYRQHSFKELSRNNILLADEIRNASMTKNQK